MRKNWILKRQVFLNLFFLPELNRVRVNSLKQFCKYCRLVFLFSRKYSILGYKSSIQLCVGQRGDKTLGYAIAE